MLVNGAGPIGSLVVAAAKYAGARTVIATDINDASLRIAKAMGADEVRNVSGGGSLPEDMELVFEASGIPAVLGGVLAPPPAAAPSSRWATCPVPRPRPRSGDLVTREITWIGSYRFVDEITDALRRHGRRPGRLPGHHPQVRHRPDAEEAMRVAADPASGSSKVMLRLPN